MIKTIVPVSSCRVAEATKLLENIFRSVNIALVSGYDDSYDWGTMDWLNYQFWPRFVTGGRRTRMLFQEAFGSDATVGVISLKDPDYNAARWWRYSEGVREVLGESIAWCYAEFSSDY